jgi:hypothetical protein
MYGNSIPNTQLNPSDSFSSKSHQYQNHPKWQEFVDYCHSQGGEPTKKGFRTWLSKQTPYWRDKVRQKPGDEKGWELNGKFYPADEAIRMAEKNSELSLKFRKAIKRDGKNSNCA